MSKSVYRSLTQVLCLCVVLAYGCEAKAGNAMVSTPVPSDPKTQSVPVPHGDLGTKFSLEAAGPEGLLESRNAAKGWAPARGDLRFKLTDAEVTIKGYGSGVLIISTFLRHNSVTYYPSTLGTPFWVGLPDCSTVATRNCAWGYTEIPIPHVSRPWTVSVGYASGAYEDFAADIVATSWPRGRWVSPRSSGSIVSALDLEREADRFALSWIHSDEEGGFTFRRVTVHPTELQRYASLEGKYGRVITAISHNGGDVTYISYGWSKNAGVSYETRVTSADVGGAALAAAVLARQGYIITAIGQANNRDGVYLVGTRVRGDVVPRAFMAAGKSTYVRALERDGYAMVGTLENSAGQLIFLGER